MQTLKSDLNFLKSNLYFGHVFNDIYYKVKIFLKMDFNVQQENKY